jgi:hypothetical protein
MARRPLHIKLAPMASLNALTNALACLSILEMIRRDYLLRMIQEFAEALSRIRRRAAAGQYDEAVGELDRAFLEFIGTGADAISRLSETELLAQLTLNEPTHVVRQKSLMLIALLQEAGQLHIAGHRDAQGHVCWIKALDMSLRLQMQDTDFQLPEFVPKIEMLHEQLREVPIPLRTLAALWRHCEHIGAYGKAEDTMFSLLEAEPDNDALLSEAKLFYERLLRQSDQTLKAGNLPRKEVVSGLAELRASSDTIKKF